MRNKSLLLIFLLLCVSCSLDDYESNPFLGTWNSQESSFENGYTIYSDFSLTFFEDYTYVVNVKYSSYAGSETFVVSGKYNFDKEKIWFDDDDKLFGNGGYCSYSLYKNVLKIEWSNKTMVFRR